MHNQDTEIIFPSRVIPSLMNIRGKDWSDFIEKITSSKTTDSELVAFTLMVCRMSSCSSCSSDSYRAMRGCTLCAKQAVKRYRGSDLDLIRVYNETLDEVEDFRERQQQDEIDKIVLGQLQIYSSCE